MKIDHITAGSKLKSVDINHDTLTNRYIMIGIDYPDDNAALGMAYSLYALQQSGIYDDTNLRLLISNVDHLFYIGFALHSMNFFGLLDNTTFQIIMEDPKNARMTASIFIYQKNPPKHGEGLNQAIINAGIYYGFITEDDVPDEYCCHMEDIIMDIPTKDRTKRPTEKPSSYRAEYKCYAEWVKQNKRDPHTRLPLNVSDLKEDEELSIKIKKFVTRVLLKIRGLEGHEKDYPDFVLPPSSESSPASSESSAPGQARPK